MGYFQGVHRLVYWDDFTCLDVRKGFIQLKRLDRNTTTFANHSHKQTFKQSLRARRVSSSNSRTLTHPFNHTYLSFGDQRFCDRHCDREPRHDFVSWSFSSDLSSLQSFGLFPRFKKLLGASSECLRNSHLSSSLFWLFVSFKLVLRARSKTLSCSRTHRTPW